MADLTIPRHILDDIVTHAKELAPYECCGFLAGIDTTVTKVYRIKNIVALEGVYDNPSFDEDKIAALARLSPAERAEIAFVMDSAETSLAQKDMRRNGLTLQAIYHSHPQSPARPSTTDIKIATDYEEYWEKIHLPIPAWLFVSLMNTEPDIKTYWIKSGEYSLANVLIT